MAALRLPAPPTATARWASPPPSARWLSSLGRGSPRRVAARRDDDAEAPPVRTLLIDNYDSYTYNIFQELSVVNGGEPPTRTPRPPPSLFFKNQNTLKGSKILLLSLR